MLTRPDPTEYAEYYKNYIARVPEGPVLDFLAKQLGDYRQLLVGVSDEAATAAPAPGKWSIKQVLGHLCDTERVMTYRALLLCSVRCLLRRRRALALPMETRLRSARWRILRPAMRSTISNH